MLLNNCSYILLCFVHYFKVVQSW